MKPSSMRAARLLLSVVNASEAAQIKAIADVVDVKDPSKGPLGAPDIHVVAETIKEVGGAVPVSASLGDAEYDRIAAHASLAKAFADEGVSIVKIAVSNLSGAQAEKALSALRESVPAHVKIVAAVYADGPAHCFISDLLERARHSGADGILLDTARKNGESLFSHMSPASLRGVVESARASGFFIALAGGLGVGDIKNVVTVNPDYAGFRSAIAVNGREAAGVDVKKARQIKTLLRGISGRR